MRISRVYIDSELVGRQVIALDKAQSHYLKNVLRLKPGAAFFLFNGRTTVDFEARLRVDGKQFTVEIGAAHPLTTESRLA
ncbi:MAG: 16S rRNA (uracil(1498)-N(3))-methyltransferase, partial [Gammaproteobacteria bacterium]|nr:16S rRNA (uracil(1498)-N(3))-methyltransferase [Gammaproteobacteria bacterium]